MNSISSFGCKYCRDGSSKENLIKTNIDLGDIGELDFSIYLTKDRSKPVLIMIGSLGEYLIPTIEKQQIHYCPMCGRKL